jgi:hypothetical protein
MFRVSLPDELDLSADSESQSLALDRGELPRTGLKNN